MRWQGGRVAACRFRAGTTKARPRIEDGLSNREAGNGLLSHALSSIVPSTLTGLTAVFGMGTGVALSR